MFQKEVADRIIAKFNTKNYGRLSILANWILEIEKICDVNVLEDPNYFVSIDNYRRAMLKISAERNI